METVTQLRRHPRKLGGMISELIADRPFDLSGVKTTLTSERGWAPSQVPPYIERYRNFMLLSALVQGHEILTPSPRIAEVWDCHVENPGNYQWFCQQVLGKMVPRNQLPSQGVRVVSFEETSEFYFQVFHEHFEIPEKTRKRAKIRYAMRQSAFY